VAAVAAAAVAAVSVVVAAAATAGATSTLSNDRDLNAQRAGLGRTLGFFFTGTRAMSGFKTQSKRHRELAKLNKRRAKDEKRALRKAERSASAGGAPVVTPAPIVAVTKPPVTARYGMPAPAPEPERKPLTFAEAVERWKATKIVKAKTRS
jgi:hypothetical protein